MAIPAEELVGARAVVEMVIQERGEMQGACLLWRARHVDKQGKRYKTSHHDWSAASAVLHPSLMFQYTRCADAGACFLLSSVTESDPIVAADVVPAGMNASTSLIPRHTKMTL